MPQMSLGELVARTPGCELHGDADAMIGSLVYDSRRVSGAGVLFAAFVGANIDGHSFVSDAISRGASAVLVSRDIDVPAGTAVVKAVDARAALGDMATALYGDPSSVLSVAGVTGTKGKTTTASILHSILEWAGRPAGLLGTISYRAGGSVVPAPNTTPEAADIQKLMHEMAAAGQTHCVMEVSSHAVSLGRIAHIDFDVGVFTNIGHDHMDFHRTLENYVDAKAGFFRTLGAYGRRDAKPWPKRAVINLDDPYGASMIAAAQSGGAEVITYSQRGANADFRAEDISPGGRGLAYMLREGASSVRVSSSLVGAFNVYNSMAAIAAARALGVELEPAAVAVEHFPGVPGRFEAVSEGQDFAVIVDYAHSPDSLANVLATAREMAQGRVISVFGCGGDRDRTKRQLMGRISAEMADLTIVTSDNPRSEAPNAIIGEIIGGMGCRDGRWVVEPDRAQAIRTAIGWARRGDVVLIAGKGHETYQIFRDRTIHFDDREVARAAIRELI
ncbi:MAG: UDP-N-acetylmuramoyl-L-alanyl-D-glutamate--2,6-diaminopimelate ligase [Clostridia bacterium]|nr:UDP-N-acetylmuramoyl-L-alanyl-D-glutamate--2,6-diaminopimelate ligase [Clostridia bacterium]